MINEIKEGIKSVLQAAFGSDYVIRTESVVQDGRVPCFLILNTEGSHGIYRGNRYNATNVFSIRYDPSSQEVNKECAGVAERLYEVLEYIPVEDSILGGSKMRHVFEENALLFSINYDVAAFRVADSPLMDEIRVGTGVKGETTECR